MKKTVFFAVLLLFFSNAKSQLTKGNWLVGGNLYYSSTKYKGDTYIQTVNALDVSPNLGYFFTDKFAVGLKPGYGHMKTATSSNDVTNDTYKIGPFARYYFLPVDKPFNLLLEGNYQYGVATTNAINMKSYTLSALGGPVLYFNSAVGLEFLFGYSTTSYIGYETPEKVFRFGIGLQVHLEKEKE